MVKAGRVIPLDRLQQSLARISIEVRGAIDNEAKVTEEDLARLCWVEVRTTFEAETREMQNDYVRTLFEASKHLLQGKEDRKYEPIEEKLSIYPDRTGQYSST